MKRILSFFMVFVLLFNFVLPRRSEAVAPAVGVLLSNPKTYVAVGSLLASAGIVYENADSLKAGVTDFLNKSDEIRQHIHNAMLISGIYLVNGIQKNIFPVNQELYNSAVEYATGHTGTSSTLPASSVIVNDTPYLFTPYNNRSMLPSNYLKSGSKEFSSTNLFENIYTPTNYPYFLQVTNDVGFYPFVMITPSDRDWIMYHSNMDVNGISFNLLGKELKVAAQYYSDTTLKYFEILADGVTVRSKYSPSSTIHKGTDVFISFVPQYANDSNGIWYKGMEVIITYLVSVSPRYRWQSTNFNDLILKCSSPDTTNEIFNLFTTYDESTGKYKPSDASYSPVVQYSVSSPVKTEWDYNADEQVGIVLPSGSIDNYVGTPESVTTGELTTYTGEKTGELDWTSTPSEGEGEEGGGSISGEFDIGKWLTGTGEGTLSGTLDNAFSNVNAKIDSLTNSISNVFNPELSWENSNFRWFDFIILFLDVILACIRLTIRFLVFVVTLTQIAATPLIENLYILDGIEFLKNLSVPNTNFSLWGLITSFVTAMFGITAFAFIKRKFHF